MSCLYFDIYFSERPLPLGKTHWTGIHCVLAACTNELGSYRKSVSNEGGHNCLNNEDKYGSLNIEY